MRLTETLTFTTFDAEPMAVISSSPCDKGLASGSIPVHTDSPRATLHARGLLYLVCKMHLLQICQGTAKS